MDDNGVSHVVGVLMILPAIVGAGALAMSAIMMAGEEIANEAQAHANRAERAAWCSEHESKEYPGEGSCPEPMPGYDCESTTQKLVVCHRKNVTSLEAK